MRPEFDRGIEIISFYFIFFLWFLMNLDYEIEREFEILILEIFLYFMKILWDRGKKRFFEKRDVIGMLYRPMNLMQYNLYSSSCCGESEWNVQNSRTDVSRNTWREYRSRVFYSSSCVHDKYLSSMSNDYSLRRGIDNSLTILLRFTRVL